LIGSSFIDKEIQTKLLTNLIDLENVMIKQFERIEFNQLSELMSESNFFIDLREKNIIFNRSLPIRIFDYMACGRPIIFSNLESLTQLTDIQSFTHLIEPEDVDKAVEIVKNYLENKKPYLSHCIEARKLFEEKYNWEAVEPKLLEIIK
jgi:glycosyltransferase involved in cell wall biosynthesis